MYTVDSAARRPVGDVRRRGRHLILPAAGAGALHDRPAHPLHPIGGAGGARSATTCARPGPRACRVASSSSGTCSAGRSCRSSRCSASPSVSCCRAPCSSRRSLAGRARRVRLRGRDEPRPARRHGRRAGGRVRLPRHQPDRRRAVRRHRPEGESRNDRHPRCAEPARKGRLRDLEAASNAARHHRRRDRRVLAARRRVRPVAAPYDPLAQDFPRLQPPSAEHWFGTDQVGRDILSRVITARRSRFRSPCCSSCSRC